MNTFNWVLTFFIIVLTSSFSISAQINELKGYVKTTDGKPIKDVEIVDFAKTNEHGFFEIKSDTLKYRDALILYKNGFVPKAIPYEKQKAEISIILEEGKESNRRQIPNCTNEKLPNYRSVGGRLILTVPKKLKFKSGVDTDYIYYRIGYKKDNTIAWLSGGLGNLYGSPFPPASQLLNLKSFSYQLTDVGIDWHGLTKEGNYWRYFGTVSEFDTYSYETNFKEAADVFDKIIDSGCLQVSDIVKKQKLNE